MIKNIIFDKTCAYCGTTYNTNIKNQKYCSLECKMKCSIEKGNFFEKECPHCKNIFVTSKSFKKFCSKDCRDKHIKGTRNAYGRGVKFRICKYCKKEFETNVSFQIYCSNDCQKLDRSIKLNSGNQWLSAVEYCLERDNYKCVRCGSIENLVCHHIKPLAFGGTNDFCNLSILCEKCHGTAHKIINKNIA